MHQGSQQHPATSMDGNRVGPSSIPVSGVDLRHHLQREQTSWRAVQVPDTEVPPDIRHPPPMLHKDHQQQTILWSNAAGMSGAMPGMQPNMPPHMPTNMPHMQGPNMPGMPPNMTATNMAPNMTNVSQSMQGMGLPHTTQAEQLHNYHREELHVERNGDQVMGGGVMVEEQDDLARKKDKEGGVPKEKGGKKSKKQLKEKSKATTPAQGDANNKPAERKASKAKVCACERCGKGFVSWQNMKIHYTNVHKEDGLCVEKQYNTKCPHEGCGKSFFHRKTMLKHLEQDHGIKTEQEHFEFESMDRFLDWKENEEADNHVYFVKQRGLRFHKGWYDQHYYCQRDGSARAHVKKGQPERKTNRRAKKGVTKTGIACPAKMSVKYQKGERKVSVIYTKTHSHPINILDTQFHPIPKRTIAQLSEQFAKGVPVKQVHREIKHVVSQYLQKDTDEKNPDEVPKNEEEKEKEKEKTEVEEGEKSNEENKEQSPNSKQDHIPQEMPKVVRILNKRQLHAIKVQADTARIRDACQKLVSVFERSARVRKKLLDHATQTVEDLLEDCISVALAPTSSPAKRSRGGRRTSAKRRKVQLKNVIQEAAEQENIPSDIQEVEIGKIEESMIEDTDEVPTEIEVTEESPSKEQEEEEVPADEQTVEIPLTNLSEARPVQLQEALPEEESCVVTLLAQMEGQTVIDYYRDKDPNVQPVVTEVRTYSGIGSGDESHQNQPYQVLIDQPSDTQSQQ